MSTNAAGAPQGPSGPEERPPTDPAKLLASWMEWERGDVTPGQTIAALKRGGLRELLESTVQAQLDLGGT
ncbi:MAG: hypothetical protein QOK43_777 [Acidimicrobiaceae bacterium]|nr:hypothetical protein [Acidimicrobiaceae bacterium]